MNEQKSILSSDVYVNSMAAAGFPLREETFYLSFRKGGIHYNCIDLEKYIKEIMPVEPTDEEIEYLKKNNYTLSSAMVIALRGNLQIRAVPKNAWFFDGEPFAVVRGPSYLASIIGTQIIWVNYPIQLATQLIMNYDKYKVIKVINDDHQKVVEYVASEVGVTVTIEKDTNYQDRVYETIKKTVAALGDDGDVALRLIEGGMRSALNMDHTRMVLTAAKELGITRVSNAFMAYELGLIPTGTSGHEHSKRCGSDFAAYSMSTERVPGLVGCLLDNWSTLQSGIPAAIKIASMYPNRNFLGRLDSGDRAAFFHIFVSELRKNNINNMVVNNAGDQNEESIQAFEPLRKFLDFPANDLSYMIGGAWTANTLPTDLTRGRVACVYKLCHSQKPRMKFSDDGLGKRSIPGDIVLWRRIVSGSFDGPLGIIAQIDEPNPDPNHYSRIDKIQQSKFFGASQGLIRKDWYKDIDIRKQNVVLSQRTKEIMNTLAKEAGL